MMQTCATQGQQALRSGLEVTESTAPLRVAILRLSDTALPKKLTPVHLKLEAFAATLAEALAHIAQDRSVIITSGHKRLLLLPALMAAKCSLRPHAYLGAMQSAADADRAADLAWQQARRGIGALHSTLLTVDSEQAAFDSLYQRVEDLAGRNLRREANRQHYWFSPPHQARVTRLVLHFPQRPPEETHLALVLSQGSGRLQAESLLNERRLLFLLSGNTRAELKQALGELEQRLDALDKPDSKPALDLALLELMLDKLLKFTEAHAGQTRYRLALQAANLAQLKSELAAISSALEKVFTTLNPYKTPAGSYFSAAPLGAKKLAFVYPGVGTVYPDMLCQLHRYFPDLFEQLEQQGDLSAMLQADAIYPSERQMSANMPLCDLAISGVGASYLLTKLMTQVFEVQPQFALGYSMGEAAMWASLDVWQQPYQLIEQTQTHKLFTSVISGELSAVRRAWGMDDQQTLAWNSIVVRAAPAEIEALLPEYPRVYLAIIQGDSCVIAGCETSCQQLLQRLGKRGIAANRVTAMHTPPALSQHSEIQSFYHLPIKAEAAQLKVRFISAANSRKGSDTPLNHACPLSSELIASAIADTFCYPLNFTALIHSAARQGARLFVEVGADRQNCTLIDKIMADKNIIDEPYSALPLNAKGASDESMILKALGQLLSHGVPVNLEVLQQGLERYIAQTHSSASLAVCEADNRFKEEA